MKKIVVCLLISCLTIQARVIEINNEQEYNNILQSERPTIIKFSADAWCGACKLAQKPFEELSNDDDFKHVMFAHVDIDKMQELSREQGIIGVPTFHYIQHGSKKEEEVGIKNAHSFKEDLRENLARTFNTANNVDTSGLVTGDDGSEMGESASTEETGKGGIFATLFAFIAKILDAIKALFIYIVEKIKSLF